MTEDLITFTMADGAPQSKITMRISAIKGVEVTVAGYGWLYSDATPNPVKIDADSCAAALEALRGPDKGKVGL